MEETLQAGLPSLELEQRKLCRRKLLHSLMWLLAAAMALTAISQFEPQGLTLNGMEFEFGYVALVLGLLFLIGLWINFSRYLSATRVLTDYYVISDRLEFAENSSGIGSVQELIAEAGKMAEQNPLIKVVFEQHLPSLTSHLGTLRQAQLQSQLAGELRYIEQRCGKRLQTLKSSVPLIKAKASVVASLGFLKKRREEIVQQWNVAYADFSWWNKLKYGDRPDLTELDEVINRLRQLNRNLTVKHGDDFSKLEAHFETLNSRAAARISQLRVEGNNFIREHGKDSRTELHLLRQSLWLSAMSFPVSVWLDLDRAGDVYDALRQVNGDFSGMSDSEIWLESLLMSGESVAGLAALAKGAYFEQLVAADTGGLLFENFNNPGTDIVIDGVAYQLKATGSADYVNSVAKEIPVISTSEVALATGAADSGFSNAELTNTVDLALGGTVVDVGDSMADAVLAGVGGLGFFATIKGVNHAVQMHENGGDGVEAAFAGAGVAIEGTAEALVGAAEMGFNVLSSRPSRFVGRALLGGLTKLDGVIMDEPGRK